MSAASQRKPAVIAAVAVVLAVVITCITLNRFILDADEAYQILNAQDWKNAPFAPLSAFCGYLWGSVFGFGWLQMRWLSMILNLVSIVCMGWWAQRVLGNVPRTLWIVAASILLYALTNDHEQKYDWDTFASFSLTITAVLTMDYAHRPTVFKALSAGAMAAVTTLFRVPSAPVIVVPVVAALFCENNAARVRDLIAMIASWAFFLLLIVCALYGSPAGYLQSVSDNAIEAHSSLYLIKTTLQSAKNIAMYVVMFALAMFVVKKCSPVQGMLRMLLAISLIAVLTTGAEWVNDRGVLFDYPFFGLVIFALLTGIFLCDRQSRICMAILLLCGLCAVSGSNCGFNRMMFYPLIPAVVAYIITDWPWWARRSICICFAAALLATLAMPVANVNVYIDRFINPTYGELGFPKAHGVYFDSVDVAWLSEVVPVIQKYKDNPNMHVTVMSEYVDGFVPEYLTDSRNPVTRHDWNHLALRTDNAATIRRIQALADSQPDTSVIIIVYSPAFDSSPKRNLTPFSPRYQEAEAGRHYKVLVKTEN